MVANDLLEVLGHNHGVNGASPEVSQADDHADEVIEELAPRLDPIWT